MTSTMNERTSDLGRGMSGRPETGEWTDFRDGAERHRHALERTLRRQLLHDPRAATARLQNFSPRDLADEALAWALEEARSKPSGTTPEQWMRS